MKHTVQPQGAIKKLSVSVLLDQDAHWEGSGANAKRVLVAPTPERIKVIHDLVAAAVGVETQRGDQLIVESLPFESTLNLEPPETNVPAGPKKPLTLLEQLKADPKLMYGLIGIALVVLLGAFFGIKMMMKRPAASVQAYVQPALPAAETPADANDAWNPSSLSTKSPALIAGRVENLTTQLRAAAQKDIEVSAGVLRGWIQEWKA